MNTASTGPRGGRPLVMGTRGVVSSGHYLATGIGMDILRRGGNAFDAAAAVGFALTALKPHQNGFGGEVPVLFYSSKHKKTWALSGNGTAPKAMTLEAFRGLGVDLIPGDGLLPALVPPIPATWMALVGKHGTMDLEEVMGPAAELCRSGFPMYDSLRGAIALQEERFKKEWPSSAAKFLPQGRVPEIGEVWKQPELGATMKKLIKAASGKRNRKAGLEAARAYMYEGKIAGAIGDFCAKNSFRDASGRSHAGFLRAEDLAAYETSFEEPCSTMYKEYKVFKCPPWTQGPVLLQCLNLVENVDLKKLGHNSAGYLHAVVECMKLAFADRNEYYADPKFVDVPMRRLLSKEHARSQVAALTQRIALPFARGGEGGDGRRPSGPDNGDTTKLEVIDSEGNMVSATTSGGWLMSSPVIPGLGFSLGTRGQMFSLDPNHPNRVEPGKRPRTTLTPGLAFKNGKPWLSFGSPGGDSQDQWALQFFLNVVEFGMNLQEAAEAPTFESLHWASSFYPRKAEPGALRVEARIPDSVQKELQNLGHRIVAHPLARDWWGGNTLAATRDSRTGALSGAASPRLDPSTAEAF